MNDEACSVKPSPGKPVIPLSLEDCCLAWLVSDLEHYPPELLALLPLRLRHRLLANVPVLDLCQLEHTSVADGVDLENIWELKCSRWGEEGAAEKERIANFRYIKLNRLSWRDRYLHAVALSILHNSLVLRRNFLRHTANEVLGFGSYFDRSRYYPVVVDCLISLKGYQFLNEGGDLQSGYDWQNLASSFFFFEAECGNRYDRLTPPRYAHYKSGCSTKLSDEELITLLLRNCHFKPKCLLILSSRFNMQIKPSGILKEFLNEVEEVHFSARDRLPNLPVVLFQMISGASPCKLRTLQLLFNCQFTGGLSEYEQEEFEKSTIRIIADVIKRQSILETIYFSFRHQLKDTVLASGEFTALVTSLISFVARSQFRTLDIYSFPVPVDVVTDILCAFVVSPCSHQQTLKLPHITAQPSSRQLHRAVTPCLAGAMPVPDSGVEYKELYLHLRQPLPADELYAQIWKTFFSFPKIRLKLLEVQIQATPHYYVNTLHMAAQHSNIQVKTLNIQVQIEVKEDLVFSTLRDDMRALLQIPTLTNLSLPPLPLDYTCPGNTFLPILAQELPKRHHLAAIEELDLGRSNFLELPAEEVEHLFQSIFSLPHLSPLVLKLTESVVSFHHYKLIHRLWTEYSSGERLKELVIGSGVLMSEKESTEEFSVTGMMSLLDSMAQSTSVVRCTGQMVGVKTDLIKAEIPTLVLSFPPQT